MGHGNLAGSCFRAALSFGFWGLTTLSIFCCDAVLLLVCCPGSIHATIQRRRLTGYCLSSMGGIFASFTWTQPE